MLRISKFIRFAKFGNSSGRIASSSNLFREYFIDISQKVTQLTNIEFSDFFIIGTMGFGIFCGEKRDHKKM
jgi:hypothetical protein